MRARLAFAMHAPAVRAAAVVAWTPLDLGASLKAWWNADDHGTANMTDAGAGVISAWKDRVSAINTTAATTARPTWAAASFNSAYAGLTFDGTANTLGGTSFAALPTGTTTSEILVLCSQTEVGSFATGRTAFCYGGNGGSAREQRRVMGGGSINRANWSDGVGGTLADISVDLSGNVLFGSIWSSTLITGRINAAASSPATAATSATTATTNLNIGARMNGTPTFFWKGVIRHIFVTTSLTTLQRQQLEGWLAWDVGLASLLPVGHPYKSARP